MQPTVASVEQRLDHRMGHHRKARHEVHLADREARDLVVVADDAQVVAPDRVRDRMGVQAVASALEVARGKPEPDVFLLAADRLGVRDRALRPVSLRGHDVEVRVDVRGGRCFVGVQRTLRRLNVKQV